MRARNSTGVAVDFANTYIFFLLWGMSLRVECGNKYE